MTGYIEFFFKCQNLNFSLTDCLAASLTTVARVEAKRSSVWSPFYATITNSPVGYAFWGSGKCRSSAPCLFFYLQSGCLSSFSSNKPYRGVNFPYQRFLSAAYLYAIELFQSWISEALQSWCYYERYTTSRLLSSSRQVYDHAH